MGKGSHIYSTTPKTHQHMQILLNVNGKTETRFVDAESNIAALKESLACEKNVEIDSLVFTQNGFELEDSDCFTSLQGEIFVEGELLGEGKGGKRKKKVYKTAKRIPHKKKNVKMMALRYYGVEPDGTVTLRRAICPRTGRMLADHYDRSSCGDCGYTQFKLTPSGERLTKRGPQVKKVEKVV